MRTRHVQTYLRLAQRIHGHGTGSGQGGEFLDVDPGIGQLRLRRRDCRLGALHRSFDVGRINFDQNLAFAHRVALPHGETTNEAADAR